MLSVEITISESFIQPKGGEMGLEEGISKVEFSVNKFTSQGMKNTHQVVKQKTYL